MLKRIIALMFMLPSMAQAESFIVGYGGFLRRIQPAQLDFSSFQNGPAALTTLAAGVGGGYSIWKIHADGTILFSRTGETNVFIGPSRSIEETTQGTSLMLDAGAGWPLIRIAGFRTLARAGYGTARIRIPTESPIEDDRRFWNYGIAAQRDVGSRYAMRIDVRNVHFRQEEIPQTLGRFNVAVLVGFGLRF